MLQLPYLSSQIHSILPNRKGEFFKNVILLMSPSSSKSSNGFLFSYPWLEHVPYKALYDWNPAYFFKFISHHSNLPNFLSSLYYFLQPCPIALFSVMWIPLNSSLPQDLCTCSSFPLALQMAADSFASLIPQLRFHFLSEVLPDCPQMLVFIVFTA